MDNFGALITPKLREKEGFIFKEAPDFYNITNEGTLKKDVNVKSMDDIKEEFKEQEETNEKRKKQKKNAPSTKDVRDYKRKLIEIHAKDLEVNFPCAYPVLGIGEKDDKKKSDNKPKKRKNDTSTNKHVAKKRKKE